MEDNKIKMYHFTKGQFDDEYHLIASSREEAINLLKDSKTVPKYWFSDFDAETDIFEYGMGEIVKTEIC